MATFKLGNKYLAEDVYKTIIDERHFLAQLKRLFDWSALAAPLADLANNTAGGRPRHAPAVMLKLLLLSFLFDLSDRDTEFFATSHLYAKYFLGLPIDEAAPDYSTLSRFRSEVLAVKGPDFFLELFRSLIAAAKAQGVIFGSIHTIDTTHSTADVDTHKDHERPAPRDPDAAWGVKGAETKLTPTGAKVEVLKTFFGYKAGLLAETNYGLVTGLATAPGDTADLDMGDDLVHVTLTDAERQAIGVLLGDKAFGCPIWINLLEKYTGLTTAFSLPKTMLRKKKWQAYISDPDRATLRKERSVIERVNADLKDNHSLRRCRYVGQIKYTCQTTLAAIAHNLKITIRILTGARLRPI